MADVVFTVILTSELFDSDDEEDMEIDDIPFLATQFLHERHAAPKVYGFTDLILNRYSPMDFKHDFRLRRETFETILGEIGPFLTYQPRPTGRRPLPPEKQLLIFMWYLSNQDSMREMGRLFGVTKFTVHRCARCVSQAICRHLMKRLIVWPDENAQADTARCIENVSSVPGVIGFIDGTHIRLSHVLNGDTGYINRKGYSSIQLQLIVNDQMSILDAYVGWPGSVHDARVYRNSPIYNDMKHSRVHLGGDRFIIGDAAYPLSSIVMTPFRRTGHLTASQKLYNQKVSSIRQTVERTIGHLKMRFRRLRDLYCMNVKDCCHLIMAACVLHNLCVISGDELTDYLHDRRDNARVNNYPPVYCNAAIGIQKRNRLVQHLQNIYG